MQIFTVPQTKQLLFKEDIVSVWWYKIAFGEICFVLIFLCCFDGMYDYFFRLHGVLNFSDVPSVYLMFSAACSSVPRNSSQHEWGSRPEVCRLLPYDADAGPIPLQPSARAQAASPCICITQDAFLSGQDSASGAVPHPNRSDLAQQQAGWKPGGSWERQQSWGQSVYSGISDAPWAIHTYQTHLTPGEGYAGQHHPYTQPSVTHLISTASGTSATPPFTTVGLPRYSSWTSHNAVRFHTPLAPFPSARGRTPWHVALSGAPLQSARTRAPLPPAPLRCPVSGPGPPAVDIAPWCQREQSLLAC